MKTDITWCVCQYMGNEIEYEIWKYLGLNEKARLYNDFVQLYDKATLPL